MVTEYLIIFSIFVAISLAIDAFSVAVSAGVYFGRTSQRQKFRLSFHFGFFQFIMPLIGWLIGEQASRFLQKFDHLVAFAILVFLGIKMINESKKTKEIKTDITRGWKLIALSISTSLDAFAVGFGLASLDGQIILISMIIGIVAATATYIGILIGERVPFYFGSWAGVFAGIVLILIGIQIVLNHLEVI